MHMREPNKKSKSRENHLTGLTLRRRELQCVGILQAPSGSCRCTVSNISVGGANLLLDELVDVSGEISLTITGFGAFRGEIVWQDGARCGMRFVGGQRLPLVGLTVRENLRRT